MADSALCLLGEGIVLMAWCETATYCCCCYETRRRVVVDHMEISLLQTGSTIPRSHSHLFPADRFVLTLDEKRDSGTQKQEVQEIAAPCGVVEVPL